MLVASRYLVRRPCWFNKISREPKDCCEQPWQHVIGSLPILPCRGPWGIPWAQPPQFDHATYGLVRLGLIELGLDLNRRQERLGREQSYAIGREQRPSIEAVVNDNVGLS